MMEEQKLIIGQPSNQTDTYVHDLDLQQVLIELWAVAATTDNWESTAYAVCALLDLIRIAEGDAGTLQKDLGFLIGLALTRAGRNVRSRRNVEAAA